MVWNSRRVWFFLWLMIAMALPGAQRALAQITDTVQMADSNGDFEFYDAVNGGPCTGRTITNNNDPTDPNFAANQFCSTSIVRVGDKVSWLSPPSGFGVGPHGTETGTCLGTSCSGNPPGTPDWMDTSNAGDPAFTVPPGSNSSFTFNTAAVYPYFCTVHLSAMTGTVVVQDYTLSILPAAQWVYTSTAASFNGTATGLPNATIPANGASAAYNSSVTLTGNGSAINETNPSPSSLAPSTAGVAFTVGDSGESAVGDYTISVNGFGADASHLAHNSNAATLHVVNLTMSAATTPSSVTIAPTDGVGKTATFQVTANGTFPSTVVPTCTITGAPSGVTCAFSSNPITPKPSAQTITMTITTNNTPSGTYAASVVINPGGGLAQKSSAFTLVVEDFTAVLTSPSSQTIPPAGTATFTGTLTPVGGYSGTVTLTCNPAAPAGATCPGAGSTTPVSLPGGGAGGSANFTLKFTDTTFLGTANFNIVATGSVGPVVHSLPVTVNVGGFSLSAPSPASVNAVSGNPSGGATSVTLTPTGAFLATVNLSCPAAMAPTGVTCTFFPSASLQLTNGPVTVQITLATTTGTPVANGQSVQISASGGGTTQTQNLTLNVTAGSGSADLGCNAFQVHNPNPVLLGSVLEFDAFTANHGPSSATNVMLIVGTSAPVGPVTVLGGACSGTGAGTTLITCNLGTLTSGAGTLRQFKMTTPRVRSIVFTSQCSSDDADPGPDLNSRSDTVFIRPRPFALQFQMPMIP